MRLSIGDPAPSFCARSNNNPRFTFDTAAGRNLALTFVSGGDVCADMLHALVQSGRIDDVHTSLFLVTSDAGHAQPGALPLRVPGVRAFYDDDGRIAALYGLADFEARPVTFVLTPRMQVAAVITNPLETHAKAVHQCLDRLPSVGDLPSMLSHPPVMIIPNVLPPDLCTALVKGYEEHGGTVSGFMRDVGGKTVALHDKNHKVRRDWNLEASDKDMITQVQQCFIRRVIPEVKKAYQFEVSRMERYIVCCYDADEGGHFRPHRDNTTRATAHRRFAVSVNLNAEDYDGGDLRFREFGMQTYRPPTGGCCIFSCSLLHEVTPVTRGMRYAFLPFLYDEAARKVREENMHYLSTDPAHTSATPL